MDGNSSASSSSPSRVYDGPIEHVEIKDGHGERRRADGTAKTTADSDSDSDRCSEVWLSDAGGSVKQD